MEQLKGYRADHNHIVILADGEFPLAEEGYVIGWSIEVSTDSTDPQIKFGYKEAPKVLLNMADGARSYGGFHCCGVPLYYDGLVKWKFVTGGAGTKALLIVTRMVPIEKTVQ